MSYLGESVMSLRQSLLLHQNWTPSKVIAGFADVAHLVVDGVVDSHLVAEEQLQLQDMVEGGELTALDRL